MLTDKTVIKKRRRNVNRVNQIMVLTGLDDILEVERLLAKSDRQAKLERKKRIKAKSRKPRHHKKVLHNQPLPQTIQIDPNIAILLINLLVAKGVITEEEVKKLKLKETNPLKHLSFDFTNKVLDRSQCRVYWLYLMKHNELFCALCGHPIHDENNKSPWKLTAEHTIPVSKGGATDSTNLVPAHSICNMIKSDIMPEEWEKVGLEMLRSYGIHVDVSRTKYKYLNHIKEIQR